nr:family 20 glycosylhydrolase [Allomuricauda sp.]
MKKYAVLLLLAGIIVSCQQKEIKTGTVAIIPKPSEVKIGEGQFVLDEKTTVSVENESQLAIAQLFFGQFESISGWVPEIGMGIEGDIKFSTDNTQAEEAYMLEVSQDAIHIKASSGAGFFYALQSLKQLLHTSFYDQKLQPNVVWGIPAVQITDGPAFEWRGYMLDVSRHFFDKEQVLKVLDFMAESKLNRFHWHLTDDQGWRLEIKQYPKLTEVGAWRADYNTTDETVSNWWGRPVQKPGEKATYGGYYTQEEVKEIVAYAKERFIEVIPEIDMPGHAQATISAYPEIGCVDAAPFVATGGVAKNNTYNPGKEETFEFAKKMLNEVMDLFPHEYVHIGGDECNKSQWLVDPHAQQRIKDEGLKDVYELQSYFLKRIEKIINARGRTMIGWDEILEGGLAPNATVMSWRGEEGGIASAKAGHEVIMTPSNYCYIDLKQGHDDLEPNLGYAQVLLSTAYNYQVIPESLSEEEGSLIKGIQANLWTESISDWGKLTYMTFPRMYAIAESGWTRHEDKDWYGFTQRLETQMSRLDAQKIRYATSAFSPWIDHEGKEDHVKITLKTEVNGLDIRYTLDGSVPVLESELYTKSFALKETKTISARAFKDEHPVGYISSLTFPVHKATGVNSGLGKTKQLTDLNYGKLDRGDPNWVSFNDGLNVQLDFEEPTEIGHVGFDALRFTIAAIYPPEHVEILGSENGTDFKKLGEITKEEISRIQGRNKIPYKVDFDPIKLKSVKVVAKEIDPIPEGHHRAGERAVLMIDELVIQ